MSRAEQIARELKNTFDWKMRGAVEFGAVVAERFAAEQVQAERERLMMMVCVCCGEPSCECMLAGIPMKKRNRAEFERLHPQPAQPPGAQEGR